MIFYKGLFPRFESVPALSSVPLFELLTPFPILFGRAKYSDSFAQSSKSTSGTSTDSEFHSEDLCFFIKWLNQRQKRVVYRIVERTRKQVSVVSFPHLSVPRTRINLDDRAESEPSRNIWPALQDWPPYVIWGPPGKFNNICTLYIIIYRFMLSLSTDTF